MNLNTVDFYKFHNKILRNPNYFKYEIYSFIKIVVSYFELSKFQEECILQLLHEIWDNRTVYFNKTRYENVILGLTLYSNELHYTSKSLAIDAFVADAYPPESIHDNLIAIYKVYHRCSEIFAPSHCGSLISSPF